MLEFVVFYYITRVFLTLTVLGYKILYYKIVLLDHEAFVNS